MDGIFWEAQQNQRISKANTDASQARSNVQTLEREVQFLSRRVERLSIACQALWELLREQTNLEDHEILAKMVEVDLRDGSADGKITRRPIACASCGQMSNSARVTCLYCEADLPKQHLFE